MTRRHGEAVEDDIGFQLAMMQLNDFAREGVEQDKAALNIVVSRIIERA
jgi:hypothetical protein